MSASLASTNVFGGALVRVRTVVFVSMVALLALALPAGAGAQYTGADVNAAVARGVAHIDGLQNADGSFGSSYLAAETSFAVTAYGVAATPPGGATDINNLPAAQQTNLREAVTWLLDNQAASGSWSPLQTYSTGLALEALSYWSAIDTRVPGAISAGRTYLISNQNAPPAVTGNPATPDCTGADGSGTEQYCGGWYYEAGFYTSADESNTGFALTGLHLTGGVPGPTATVNLEWQRHVQSLMATNPLATRNDGGGNYCPGCTDGSFSSNANNTGSLLFGLGYDGVAASDPKVQAAILFAQDVLDEYELMKATVRSAIYHFGAERDGTCVIGDPACTWAVTGDGGYHYSLWSLTKGLGQYVPDNLSDPTNWYYKVVDLLLTQQNVDGSWPVDGRDDATDIVATGFAINALGLAGVIQRTLTVTKGGSGSGTVTSSPAGIDCGADCSEAYTEDTVVTLTANPAANSTFAGWSGACTGTGTCSVTMSQDQAVTATFNTVGGPDADLALTKTDSPDPVTVGQTLTYTLTARNNGPAGATGVVLTDTLPGGVTFNSATPSQGSCTQASGTVTCNLGALANGASATVQISATPQTPGSITNSASVAGSENDPSATNNTATQDTTVQSQPSGTPGCEVEGEGRIKAAKGDKAHFSVDVESGTSPRGKVTYEDHGPAAKFKLKSTRITDVTVSADRTQVTVLGNAIIKKGGPVDFQVDLEDLPGKSADTFRIRLSNGYDSGEQTIRRGDVEVECEDEDEDNGHGHKRS
jgi:uncharacterized repeat protein (TIGR01451 family)